MKKYLILISFVLFFPAVSRADILGQSPVISGAGITTSTYGFWDAGPSVDYFNLGQPAENSTSSYLGINSYNPNFLCLWGDDFPIISYFSSPFYTSSSLIGSFGNIADSIVYNADGSTIGDSRQETNGSSSLISVFVDHSVTSSYYYQLNPSCHYSATATNHLNVLSHPSFLVNNQTTSLQYVWANNLNESLNLPSNTNSCDIPYSVSLNAPVGTIANDFSTWDVSTTPLLEGCTYKISVIYTPEIGSISTHSDSGLFAIDPSTPNASFNIAKAINIWNFYNATTTPIDYTVQIQNTSNGVVDGSAQGTFYLAFNSTTINAPPGFDSSRQCGGVCQGFGTVGGGSIATPTSTIAATGNSCVPAADWTDIGGGIAYGFCSTLNFLFVPNDSTQGILAGDMNTLQSVPPFSWFFTANTGIESASLNPNGSATYLIGGSATSTSVTPDNGLSFEILDGINGSTSSMTILPADLTSNSFLSARGGRLVDDYYNLVLTFCITLAILGVYKIIL